MATITIPPRTPSPKVRIRSQSFDTPSSRISVTPLEESPFSKSTGSIATKSMRHHAATAQHGAVPSINVLLPLHTKMSDESILSDASSASSSIASSPTDSESNMDLCADSPSPSPSIERERPHPLAFAQTIDYNEPSIEQQQTSPFLYQDTSYQMYSPLLVKVVLDLCDVRGLDWMSIAEPVERIWGVKTCAAEVLDILSSNGRVLNRQWWD
ncbi:hypothetical protein T440DRAFT_137368 [Plenodomus tracheiphilus IPT5]|uniref:Uncharacterized protein n=1 Tax=Plenodomus tracheiphilus IPT5 TaxID=1408161 RepID=A0A6A7B0P0_9PLEO|nr:hypothetical protein T440DRAFT_137368 [Plenodomus tracheiphilus IPT5]